MLLWLAYLPLTIIVTVLCYLLNPVVVLFCDEDGELPSFLHYFQTWDDSCDSEFFMKECVPSFLDYGYDDHYISGYGTDKWIAEYGKTRAYSNAKEYAVWTIKQRIQRYVCRVLWLTRNCAYGFMLHLFGADMSKANYEVNNQHHFLAKVGNIWTKPFSYKNEDKICGKLYWKIYLGWKAYPNIENAKRCMLAYRLLVKVEL